MRAQEILESIRLKIREYEQDDRMIVYFATKRNTEFLAKALGSDARVFWLPKFLRFQLDTGSIPEIGF